MAQQVSFRVSEWGRNNKGNNEAIFHSRIYEGISYRFSTERERNRYFCANCYSKDKIKVRLVIRDDVFSRNPDELPHVCRQIKEATIYAVKNRKVVNIVSCYFHFTKNCTSHAADLGLKHRLQKDKSLRKWFKTLVGGVHLITDHQKALWDYLLLNAPQIAEYAALASFIQYFQRQWNVETARELLNQYNNDGPRTTNFSEGWNFTLRNQFGAKHPALGEFIQSMQKELYAHSVQSERLFRGQPIRLRKQKYRKAEKQLAEIRLEYVAAMEHLGEEITQDDIQAVLIPFARKMAYCCATFVDAEMLLENSALEEEEPAAGEENEQNSELSSFFAVIDD
ncbi:hypothetical protein Ddc_18929 [Ditylenchus destructor]|nr:hypothetical protein Ddc_18929 [Ditylenchus destructor]